MIVEISGSNVTQGGVYLTLDQVGLPISGATIDVIFPSSSAGIVVEVPQFVSFARQAETSSYAHIAAFARNTLGIIETASYATVANSLTPVADSYYTDAGNLTGTIPNTVLPDQIVRTGVTASIESTDINTSQLRIDAGTAQFVMTGSITSGIFGVTEYIRPYVSMMTYSGVVVEYVAQRPTGVRLGLLLGLWDGSDVTFTDISTTDIGDTEDLSLSIIQNGSDAIFRVHSEGSGSGAWTIQSSIKLFPKLT